MIFQYILAPATPTKYLIETMTGGVALPDYNGDRRLGKFLLSLMAQSLAIPNLMVNRPINGAPQLRNWLFRNNRDGTFTHATLNGCIAGKGDGTRGRPRPDLKDDGNTDPPRAHNRRHCFISGAMEMEPSRT